MLRAVAILTTALGAWSLGRAFNGFVWVSGGSMAPTLHEGQVLRYARSVPPLIERGTIVIVELPGQARTIKRVVGLPGEVISFDRGEVFVDGRMLYEPYLLQSVTTFSWDRPNLVAKRGEYVVLGDERLTSEDSRQCGAVPKNRIIGIVRFGSGAPEILKQPHYRISLKQDSSQLGKGLATQAPSETHRSL